MVDWASGGLTSGSFSAGFTTGTTPEEYQHAWLACGLGGPCSGYGEGQHVFTVSQVPLTVYTLSGALCGITSTDLYIKDHADNYCLINTDNSLTFYSFEIMDNQGYKIVFSDGHEYEFVCSGDLTYDRDICVKNNYLHYPRWQPTRFGMRPFY